MNNLNQAFQKEIGQRLFLKVWSVLCFPIAIPSSVRAFFTEGDVPVRTEEKDSFHFDTKTDKIEWRNKRISEPYFLIVDGLVEKPVKLSYSDLRKFPQTVQVSDIHCLEGWSAKDISWGGFRFEEILKLVKTKPKAEYVLFHALGETNSKPQGQGHYIECFPVRELLDPEAKCLMTLDVGGETLTHDHGAPLRVIAPYSQGYKSIKYVSRIEFVEQLRAGWWTLSNPSFPAIAPVPKNR